MPRERRTAINTNTSAANRLNADSERLPSGGQRASSGADVTHDLLLKVHPLPLYADPRPRRNSSRITAARRLAILSSRVTPHVRSSRHTRRHTPRNRRHVSPSVTPRPKIASHGRFTVRQRKEPIGPAHPSSQILLSYPEHPRSNSLDGAATAQFTTFTTRSTRRAST